MRILLYRADGDTPPWIDDFAALLPQADICVWSEDGGLPPCDYAVVWQPPVAMLPVPR